MTEHPTVQYLKRVLDDEASALKGGDLSALERLSDLKAKAFEAILNQVKATQISPRELQSIQETARKNAQLVLAARKAVASVVSLRTQNSRPQQSFATYNANGDRQRF